MKYTHINIYSLIFPRNHKSASRQRPTPRQPSGSGATLSSEASGSAKTWAAQAPGPGASKAQVADLGSRASTSCACQLSAGANRRRVFVCRAPAARLERGQGGALGSRKPWRCRETSEASRLGFLGSRALGQRNSTATGAPACQSAASSYSSGPRC